MTYTIAQLAYLAGIIDGEGTISICDKRVQARKSKGIRKMVIRIYRARINFSTHVTVCNTDPRIMDWLIENFGGSISVSKRQKENWKIKLTWVMPTKLISTLLEAILPFLILKAEQAKLMIEARKTFDENQRALITSDEIYQRRLEICQMIRNHNQRILPPCCPAKLPGVPSQLPKI